MAVAVDSENNFWLFGGVNSGGLLNDLWRYDGNWTWISGGSSNFEHPVYGTEGEASTDTVPGSRYGPMVWIDNDNAFWLFGGYALDGSPLGEQGKPHNIFTR